MSSLAGHPSLEEQISQWREFLRHRAAIHGSDVAELEDHLRSQVATLTGSGLSDDEAFLVAVKRMGNLDAVSREFAREHSERLWKQMVMTPETDEPASRAPADFGFALLLALAAAVAIKLPYLFGVDRDNEQSFYLRNASLLVFPLLALFFAWKRALSSGTRLWLGAGFVVAALVVNLYPFARGGNTLVLAALHLPIALWLLIGVAYAGGQGFGGERRMDFVRFSGEFFIYYVLIGLGGAVLTGFTVMMFNAIGLHPGWFVGMWLVPCGAAAAVIIAAWLVEAKQSVIENMAPVLTRLFTPLFTIVILIFLAVMAWTGNPIDAGREILIGFDLLLVVVVGLVLYSVSARDPRAPAGVFDALQLLLVCSAVLADGMALAAIAGRIFELGFTPNRVAALGENLILLANLGGSAWLYVRFLRGQGAFGELERWQLAFIPVYAAWAAIVVVVFPPLFDWI
jgi:hypothetical protein